MEIYAVKILDINEDELDKLCLLIDSEKKYKVKNLLIKKIRLGH